MSNTVRNLALVAWCLDDRPAARPRPIPRGFRTTSLNAPFRATNPTLLASLQRIWRGSPLWREAVTNVRKTGRYVLVATPGDVTLTDRNQSKQTFDPQVLGEAFPVLDNDARIQVVVVVVNLRLVQESHDARVSVRRDFDADLDRIVVHEVYGHAVPYLLAGNLLGDVPIQRAANPPPRHVPSGARTPCGPSWGLVVARPWSIQPRTSLGSADPGYPHRTSVPPALSCVSATHRDSRSDSKSPPLSPPALCVVAALEWRFCRPSLHGYMQRRIVC